MTLFSKDSDFPVKDRIKLSAQSDEQLTISQMNLSAETTGI